MKVKYLGFPADPESSPRTTTFGGVRMPRGVFVTLPDDFDPKAFAKLTANLSFEVAEGEGEAPPPPEPEAAQTEDSPAGKDAILARLDAIAAKHPEVTFDPKASVAKLKATLEAAEFEHGDD